MFDEYSLADSQTLGTGYVVNTPHDGSVSMITHEFADQDSQTTASNINNNTKNDNGGGGGGHNYDSAWSVFGLFRVSIRIVVLICTVLSYFILLLLFFLLNLKINKVAVFISSLKQNKKRKIQIKYLYHHHHK
jgi:hypothetical protein